MKRTPKEVDEILNIKESKEYIRDVFAGKIKPNEQLAVRKGFERTAENINKYVPDLVNTKWIPEVNGNCLEKNCKEKAEKQAVIDDSFFSKKFNKIPIIISKNDEFKGWRAEIADNYENYKPEKYDNINFEDLGFHFRHSVKTHEFDNLVFNTRKDAVKCAKEVMEKEKLNCKIWFL